MKRINIILISLLLISLITCDVIEKPYFYKDDYEDVACDLKNFPPLPAKTERKILLEDFTGHLCSNCPKGHQVMNKLITDYNGRLIGMCIHAGSDAEPSQGNFSYDFRTTAGNEIKDKFRVSVYPSGMVNRVKNSKGEQIYLKDEWENMAATQSSEASAALQIINFYDDTKQKLCTNVKVTMLANYPNPLRLVVMMTEDSIIKPQQNNRDVDLQYVHMHVLRTALNSTWGVRILNGQSIKDATEIKRYSVMFKDTDRVPKNCSIVAYLSDETTNEIIQVEKLKIN